LLTTVDGNLFPSVVIAASLILLLPMDVPLQKSKVCACGAPLKVPIPVEYLEPLNNLLLLVGGPK